MALFVGAQQVNAPDLLQIHPHPVARSNIATGRTAPPIDPGNTRRVIHLSATPTSRSRGCIVVCFNLDGIINFDSQFGECVTHRNEHIGSEFDISNDMRNIFSVNKPLSSSPGN